MECGSFEWKLFKHPGTELHTTTVLSSLKFCTNTVTSKKQVKVPPTQKPWFKNRLREQQLIAHDAALDQERSIGGLGTSYAKNTLRTTIMNRAPAPLAKQQQPYLTGQLNTFFAHSSCSNRETDPNPDSNTTTPESNQTLDLQIYQVKQHYTTASTAIKQLSKQPIVPTATIISVPKTLDVTSLNDYQLVRLNHKILWETWYRPTLKPASLLTSTDTSLHTGPVYPQTTASPSHYTHTSPTSTHFSPNTLLPNTLFTPTLDQVIKFADDTTVLISNNDKTTNREHTYTVCMCACIDR